MLSLCYLKRTICLFKLTPNISPYLSWCHGCAWLHTSWLFRKMGRDISLRFSLSSLLHRLWNIHNYSCHQRWLEKKKKTINTKQNYAWCFLCTLHYNLCKSVEADCSTNFFATEKNQYTYQLITIWFLRNCFKLPLQGYKTHEKKKHNACHESTVMPMCLFLDINWPW